nr:hypothetical protein [Tanacetum cinerariifolium]
MTTPRSPDTSRTRIFISFIILPDYEDEDTTLPIRSALLPPLPLFKEIEHDIVAAKQQATDLQDSQVQNSRLQSCTVKSRHDVDALHARAEATEQRV